MVQRVQGFNLFTKIWNYLKQQNKCTIRKVKIDKNIFIIRYTIMDSEKFTQLFTSTLK